MLTETRQQMIWTEEGLRLHYDDRVSRSLRVCPAQQNVGGWDLFAVHLYRELDHVRRTEVETGPGGPITRWEREHHLGLELSSPSSSSAS